MQFNTTKYINENQGNETLKDVSKSGKERPWKEKKIDNVSYAGSVAKSENHLGFAELFNKTFNTRIC